MYDQKNINKLMSHITTTDFENHPEQCLVLPF